ncbi:Z1 domain-containing protein [Rhodococcus sp. NPDC056506]|uniref:Z1 domain-containing protein n=1 Tax=Rhodococcus sp. NPDC056506 TaxID=3345844 RepID=UPI00366E193E
MNEDKAYELFFSIATKAGVEAAKQQWVATGMMSEGVAERLRLRYLTNVDATKSGFGQAIVNVDTWPYPGPGANDVHWHGLVEELTLIGRERQIPELDQVTSEIVALTPDPSKSTESRRGLVVGYVQSGKTTNFTAVIAKVADLGYNLVIVLSGIHNSLRAQTQVRLNQQLVAKNQDKWFNITSTTQDFPFRPNSKSGSGHLSHGFAAYVTSAGKTSLIVAKKNATVLRRLADWLGQKGVDKHLKNARVLVIDDEADQASIETRAINPLIREILGLTPGAVYIGYTATPFANVFIDPSDSDDLYPRDFMLNLPQPKGYFGPEMLFGRTDPSPDEPNIDGYDMIRSIPAQDAGLLRPMGKKAESGFSPTITNELRDALRWFLLATAARFTRTGPDHSSMLIHTSFKTLVHESFKEPLQLFVDEHRVAVENRDLQVLDELRTLWKDETSKVDPSVWNRETEPFDQLVKDLGIVLSRCKVIIDNSTSSDRLDYTGDEPVVAIAVGGNTLSRGLTLEGLVSSVFIRPSNTYDTLMQMGRWFGFRNGYEDLPRIWMTDELRSAFRHLSLVEHEMRQDIDVYKLQNKTPMEVAVRIRTHPSLRITAKMGAAAPAKTSYSGARLQTRYFRENDPDWLTQNLDAAERLLQSVAARSVRENSSQGDHTVYRNVHVSLILEFLDSYQVHSNSTDMDVKMLTRYIEKAIQKDDPELLQWNVAVMTGDGEEREFAGETIKHVIRSRLIHNHQENRSDIKTLMSKQDIVVDIKGMNSADAKNLKEVQLKVRRSNDHQTKGVPLLLLYPIDKASSPVRTGKNNPENGRADLAAVITPVGLAIVFPITDDTSGNTVRTTHMAIELPPHSEIIETHEYVFGEELADE